VRDTPPFGRRGEEGRGWVLDAGGSKGNDGSGCELGLTTDFEIREGSPSDLFVRPDWEEDNDTNDSGVAIGFAGNDG